MEIIEQKSTKEVLDDAMKKSAFNPEEKQLNQYHRALEYARAYVNSYSLESDNEFTRVVQAGSATLLSYYGCNIPNWRGIHYSARFLTEFEKSKFEKELKDLPSARESVELFALNIFHNAIKGSSIKKSNKTGEWQLEIPHKFVGKIVFPASYMSERASYNLLKWYCERIISAHSDSRKAPLPKDDLLSKLEEALGVRTKHRAIEALASLDDIIFCLAHCQTTPEVNRSWTCRLGKLYFDMTRYFCHTLESNKKYPTHIILDNSIVTDPYQDMIMQRYNPGGCNLFMSLAEWGQKTEHIGWGNDIVLCRSVGIEPELYDSKPTQSTNNNHLTKIN